MQNTIELVLTAPEKYGSLLAYDTRSRTTLGALFQIISQARDRIMISAPFIQPTYWAVGNILAEALYDSAERGVNIYVLSTGEGIQALIQNPKLNSVSNKLKFFQPCIGLSGDNRIGSHAKLCVADGQFAYVGSANLTTPGLTNQLEFGVLVSGDIAKQIQMFWDYVIEVGLFVPIKLT